MKSARSTILLVHDDSDLLDVLTRLLEARGFRVAIAATSFSAMMQLQSRADFAVIIAGWDVARGLGAEIYQWALRKRYHLRGQFVFLSEETHEEFDDVVQGRCLLVHPEDIEEIIRVTEAAIERAERVERSHLSDSELQWLDSDRPALLLVDDEPLQLKFMRKWLTDVGFVVTTAESGNAAIARARDGDFHVILSDWFMPDGSGADLLDWLREHRPDLAPRVVFMSGGTTDDFDKRAPGYPLIPKGQDSPTLVRTLLEIASEGEESSA